MKQSDRKSSGTSHEACFKVCLQVWAALERPAPLPRRCLQCLLACASLYSRASHQPGVSSLAAGPGVTLRHSNRAGEKHSFGDWSHFQFIIPKLRHLALLNSLRPFRRVLGFPLSTIILHLFLSPQC